MSGTITLYKDTTRAFYSSYRPIDVWAYITDSDVAFLRGELYIEQNYGANNFVSTGVVINGYEQSADAGGFQGVYSFNLMEYVRHYVGKANAPLLSFVGWTFPGYYETNRFYLKIWTVRYTSNQGVSYDDRSTTIDSSVFIATPANVHNDVVTDAMGNNLWLDSHVLGRNGSALATNNVLPLTKMPNSYNYVKENGFMIDMEDFPCDSLYTYWNKNKDNELVHLMVMRYNDGVNYTGADIIKLNDQFSRKERIPVHPLSLSAFISMHTGTSYFNIVDISGNLICKRVGIHVVSGNNPAGFFPTDYWKTTNFKTGITKTIYHQVCYTDLGAETQGKCQRTKFIFQNSLGGFDWFSCYGTIEESVSIDDVRYDKHGYYTLRENHTTTKLIVNRKDNVKVVSQPLGKEQALYLAELYSSPKVWVQKKLKHSDSQAVFGEYRLMPINIKPNTWDLYSTEENVYFLEFEYTYSEDNTQPRG